MFELIQQEDLYWLIEEVKNTKDEEYKEKLALIIYRMLFMEPDWYNIAYELKSLPIFDPYYISFFGPIDYESELASKMREDHEREQSQNEQIEQLRRTRSPAQLDQTLQERMRTHIDGIERGEMHCWVRLNREMMSENRRVDNQSVFNPNLTSIPGWRLSSEETRIRILSAAKKYIIKGEPDNQEWVGTNKISFPAYAGYRALRLILEKEPEWFGEMTSEIWQKWIPIILLYEFGIYGQNVINPEEVYLNRDDTKLRLNPEIVCRNMLLQMVYPYAKKQLVATLLSENDYLNGQTHSLTILSRIELLYDSFIGKSLQDKLEKGNLNPDIVGNILEFLLSHDYEITKDYAKKLLKNHSSQNENEKLKSIQAAKTLLIFSPQNSWESVTTIIQSDIEWGREVIENVANEARFNKEMFENYLEDQLADLYIWVSGQYPKDSDKKLTGGPKFLQPDDFIRAWRDDIINYLEIKGTSDSVMALHKIIRHLPEIRESIAYRIIRAQEITRMKSWKPPKPQEIYDLFQNSRSRLIQSEVHLLEATIESLVRFEDEIQGRGYTPVAINFWDYKDRRVDKPVFRPKHEEVISDNVKNHLFKDLNNVIIHREVDISPSSTPDVVINAFKPRSLQDQNRVISIVVEIKGRWHPKLAKNMQDQLLEKYMKPRELSHGLYLVGWFESEYWDPDDSKLKSPSIKQFQSLPELNNYLQAQAQELSKEGFLIKSKIIDVSLNDIHLNRYRS